MWKKIEVRLFIFVFVAIFSITSCSSEQSDSDGGDLTRGEVEFLSSRLAGKIEEQYPVIKHKLLNRYITTLGQSLLAKNTDMPPLPYEFRVIKTNEVFLTSLPGGIIYVSLGTLRLLEFEGQLVAALSHEIAHQRLSHQLLQWRKKVNANRGKNSLLDFSGDWKDEFLNEGGALYLDPGYEEEADRLGPIIMFRGGFDPRYYVSFLERLHDLSKNDPEKIASYFSLHPPIKNRIAWAKEGTNSVPPFRDAVLASESFNQIKQILKNTEKKPDTKKIDKPKAKKK